MEVHRAAAKTRRSQNLINIKKEEEEEHLCMTLRVIQVNVCCESYKPICIYVCLFLYSVYTLLPSPLLSPSFFTYCMSLECMLGSVCERLGSRHCRPTGSAEQSLGVGERGGLQLLPPVLHPHSPGGESSAGLLPSGSMNISYPGALSWTSTNASPASEGAVPFCLAGTPKTELGVGRSRAGRGPLAWGAWLGVWRGEGEGSHRRNRGAAPSPAKASALNEVTLVF